MKNRLFLTVAAIFISSAAFAALGDVVTSFPSPSDDPLALAISNNIYNFWVYCDKPPGSRPIYRMNANTGSIYDSYDSPFGAYTHGLTHRMGGYLYAGNSLHNYIHMFNSTTGSTYSSFPAGHDMTGGLALQGGAGGSNPQALFSGDWAAPLVYRQSYTNGSIYSSFTPAGNLVDLAWDYVNGLIWGGVGGNIYGYNTAGSLVATFTAPANFPGGMCYLGNYLWIGTSSGSQYIWKVHCPSIITVEPTSIGKVKALFK